jgi:hypothetical protein
VKAAPECKQVLAGGPCSAPDDSKKEHKSGNARQRIPSPPRIAQPTHPSKPRFSFHSSVRVQVQQTTAVVAVPSSVTWEDRDRSAQQIEWTYSITYRKNMRTKEEEIEDDDEKKSKLNAATKLWRH